MKNKDTDEVIFVVVFTLLHKEDVEKEEAEAAKAAKPEESKQDGAKQGDEEAFEPQAEDVD